MSSPLRAGSRIDADGDTRLRAVRALTAKAVAVQCLIAAVSPAVVPAVALFLAVGAQALFGSAVPPSPGDLYQDFYSDVAIYCHYATQAISGKIPYRDFHVEYPPLSFPFFLLPRFFSGTVLGYSVAFALELLGVQAIAVYLVVRTVSQRDGVRAAERAVLWYTAFFAALCPVVVGRYDLLPMTLAFCAALAWTRSRAGAGGALAALGALVKLYPALCVAPAFLWRSGGTRPLRWRGVSIFCLVLSAGIAGWYLMAPDGLRYFVSYHAGRGLEIESLYAGVLMLAAKLNGAQIHSALDHTCWQLITPWSASLARLCLPVQAVILTAILARFAVLRFSDPLRVCATLILAFMITGKVLSPQYLIWLFPFVAVLPEPAGARLRRVFLVCCVMTTALFPFAFPALVRFTWFAVALLNLRNLGLVCMLLLLLRESIWTRTPSGAMASVASCCESS
jgi:hypothetical protein